MHQESWDIPEVQLEGQFVPVRLEHKLNGGLTPFVEHSSPAASQRAGFGQDKSAGHVPLLRERR